MSSGVSNISDAEAIIPVDVEGVGSASAVQDHIQLLFGHFLKVMTPSGFVQEGWQLEAEAQVDQQGLVDVTRGEQSLSVSALYLLQLNADLLQPPPSPNSASAAVAGEASCSQACRPADESKEVFVYLASHPHVEGASQEFDHGGDPDYVPSTMKVVLKESHVDIGSVRVAACSWRGAHVDKACCAFKLATHFISRFQKVCLQIQKLEFLYSPPF